MLKEFLEQPINGWPFRVGYMSDYVIKRGPQVINSVCYDNVIKFVSLPPGDQLEEVIKIIEEHNFIILIENVKNPLIGKRFIKLGFTNVDGVNYVLHSK